MADKPVRKQFPVPFGTPLVEIETPTAGNGLLRAATNMIYRRFGAWGTRPGAQQCYGATQAGAFLGFDTIGYRWYPNAGPVTIVISNGSLFYSFFPPSTSAPPNLIKLMDFSSGLGFPSFTSAFDPEGIIPSSTYLGEGATDLIICGMTTPGTSFNVATFSIGTVNPAASTITVTLTPVGGLGFAVANIVYTVLPSDNTASIVAAIVLLINQSLATLPPPFCSQAYIVPGNAAQFVVYSFLSGATGTLLTYNIGSTAGGFNGTPAAPTAPTGGGSASSAPIKVNLNGASLLVTGLSGAIQNAFTGCVTWHNHVWFWGDPNNPGTLYAADINEPQNWQFMTTEGGYPIGLGDGDPAVIDCIPVGNILYVFKKNSIYAITGYDFQAGEYQFNVQPAIKGAGLFNMGAGTVLRNALVFWTGSTLRRLAVGAFDTEPIGTPIPLTEGALATFTMWAVAGSFYAQTLLAGIAQGPQPFLLSNVAIFNNGNTHLVYDDDATNALGNYCWSQWFGPTTQGPNFTQGGVTGDLPLALAPTVDANHFPFIQQIGANAGDITVQMKASTGWVTGETPVLLKELHNIYLVVNASGVTAASDIQIQVVVTPSLYNTQANTPSNYAPQTVVFSPTALYAAGIEKMQTFKATLKPFLKATAFSFDFSTILPTTAAQVELVSMVLDYIEEPFEP